MPPGDESGQELEEFVYGLGFSGSIGSALFADVHFRRCLSLHDVLAAFGVWGSVRIGRAFFGLASRGAVMYTCVHYC